MEYLHSISYKKYSCHLSLFRPLLFVLYSSHSYDFANVETSEYIALSVENLFKAYDSNIKLNLDIQSCNLHMDKAIPMGLVLNELGLNAITHAFNGGKGNFYVKFTYEDGIYALDVWDDGVGLPESVDIHKSTTL